MLQLRLNPILNRALNTIQIYDYMETPPVPEEGEKDTCERPDGPHRYRSLLLFVRFTSSKGYRG